MPDTGNRSRFLQKFRIDGDPGTTRTPNILIRSQVLYPVELRDRDSPDNGSENGSQHAVPLLISRLGGLTNVPRHVDRVRVKPVIGKGTADGETRPQIQPARRFKHVLRAGFQT